MQGLLQNAVVTYFTLFDTQLLSLNSFLMENALITLISKKLLLRA